jgi:hypothetical protein
MLIVTLIFFASLTVRWLLSSAFGTTAILYIAVPYVITMTLVLAEPDDGDTWRVRYWRGFRRTFGVLFAVSILLYEGVVCILMFLPIYLLVVGLAFLGEYIRRKRTGTLRAFAIPALVALASLEGTHESLSFSRENTVSASRIVAKTQQELFANIGTPFNLQKDRHWFLHIFPMPDPILRKELIEGDVHEVGYTYHRWFFMNTHRGRMLLEISEVGDNHVRTTILEDTSYISHYLTLHGTRIDLVPLDDSTTEVRLTVDFARKLDPAWYFGPLQRYGVTKMAEFLIDEVIVR